MTRNTLVPRVLRNPDRYPDSVVARARAIRAAEERELAAEARHGGRAIVRKLAAGLPSNLRVLRHLTEKGDREGYNRHWRYSIDPSSGGWAPYARDLANGRDDWGMEPKRRLDLTAAEAMLSWPVYRAALAAEAVADLWGQASPAEERVLATLVQCAGLPVSTPAFTPEEQA